ncbi:hypothetical protein GCM10010307_47950 [Streptomyces vastus]|uniref:Uncharacterized protein n=1 Tax=Streptomyces vastus TaxID=285451 RepID=A0ABP6DFI7_9ACTN
MGFHGGFAEGQLGGQFGVGETAAQEGEDFEFPGSQGGEVAVRGRRFGASALIVASGTTPMFASGTAPTFASGTTPMFASGTAPTFASGTAPTFASGKTLDEALPVRGGADPPTLALPVRLSVPPAPERPVFSPGRAPVSTLDPLFNTSTRREWSA